MADNCNRVSQRSDLRQALPQNHRMHGLQVIFAFGSVTCGRQERLQACRTPLLRISDRRKLGAVIWKPGARCVAE